MTQIELFGCTSAGKSTLASNIFLACQRRGIDLLMSDDFVIKQARLNWIKSKLARTLLMDLLSLSACLVTWRNNLEFYVFAFQIIRRLPIPQSEKLNLVRNVMKRIGTHEIIHRRGSDQQIVLVDGGTLQAAHHLFVHVSSQPNASDLLDFVKLVPLPDVAIYVVQSESVLIERTMRRGHKRIPDHSRAQVKIFVRRATETLDELAQQAVLEGRLLLVDSQRNILVAQDYQDNPLLTTALEIIRAERDAALVDHPIQDHARL